jgi:hypothetical protein
MGHAHFAGVPLQVAPAAQTFPQAPQFCSSVCRFTQCVGVRVGQGVGSDAGHWQVPPTHTSFVRGQAFPHADAVVPQCSGSISQLVQSVPLQSFGRGS